MNNKDVYINFSFASILKVIFAVLAIVLAYYVKDVLVLIFLAFILASTIEPLVEALRKRKIPSAITILAIYAIIIFSVVLTIRLIIPPLSGEATRLYERLPVLIEDISNTIFANNGEIAQDLSEQALEYVRNLRVLPTGALTGFFTATLNIFSFLVSMIVVLVLTFYLLMEKDRLGTGSFKYIPLEQKDLVIKIFNRITDKLSNWLKGQIVLSLLIGFLTYITLLILQIPFALPLALFAGLMEFVPFIGPFISFIPAGVIALSISPMMVFWTALAYFIIQQLENHVVVPQVMKKALGISPVVIIISVLIGTKLLGIVGILVAAPVVASIWVVLEEIHKDRKKKKR
jgi:predicted PurR-regulated permease PerM